MMNLHIPILLVAIIGIGAWIVTARILRGKEKMNENEEHAYLAESMRKLDEKQSGGEPPELYPKHPQMPGSVTGETNALKAEIERLRKRGKLLIRLGRNELSAQAKRIADHYLAKIEKAEAEVERLKGYQKVHESELGVCEQYCERVQELKEGLADCICQIEYLHSKFQETGTGNAVLQRSRQLLEEKP